MNTQTGPARMVTLPCAACGRLNRVDAARASAGPRCGVCRERIQLDRPVALSDAILDRVLGDAQIPVLVDFYADWCGPCKVMAPLLDEVARSRAGEVLVGKIDTDRNPAAAARFRIQGVPTLVLFSGGREARREVGALPRGRLEAMLG
jgi:thioredoxin 2